VPLPVSVTVTTSGTPLPAATPVGTCIFT
jgi:hypothetical protein